MFGRLWQKLKLLWKLAKSERASPGEIGWAVALGAFAGCTPALGMHGWLALGLATLFKKNRMFAWMGSRISNMIMLPFIALAEIQLSHRLRTAAWLDIDRMHVIDQAPGLLLDWCLGAIPVGAAIGGLLGLGAYALARRRDARADATSALTRNDACEATPTPSERPPPSSESRA